MTCNMLYERKGVKPLTEGSLFIRGKGVSDKLNNYPREPVFWKESELGPNN